MFNLEKLEKVIVELTAALNAVHTAITVLDADIVVLSNDVVNLEKTMRKK